MTNGWSHRLARRKASVMPEADSPCLVVEKHMDRRRVRLGGESGSDRSVKNPDKNESCIQNIRRRQFPVVIRLNLALPLGGLYCLLRACRPGVSDPQAVRVSRTTPLPPSVTCLPPRALYLIPGARGASRRGPWVWLLRYLGECEGNPFG